jgi:hypothetical protein
MKQCMRELKLDAVYGLDWETFWSQDYTLSKLATTDYIYDQRFETQLVAVQKDSWAKPKVMEIGAFRTWAKTINWSRAGMLAHHAQFDGLIAHKHFGIQPAFFFDTLSMARALMPINVPRRLDSLARALGFAGKVHGAALTNTKGKRWAEFTKQEKAELKVYAGDDISDTWGVFLKLLEYMPLDELRLVDATMKLYCRPRLLIDKPMMQGVLDGEINRKTRLLGELGTTAKELGSDPVFAEKLTALGVDPPTKWSDKKRDTVFAFAKNDLEFKELLDHDNEDVVSLVEARLNIKSKMVESRAERLCGRAAYGPQPIYLNYWGAGPGRWSGGDKCLTGDTQIKVKRAGHTMNIRLDSLRNDDLVWDGEAYVTHGGLQHQGKREVIEHDGIKGTPDHKVYLAPDALPITLAEAKRRRKKLASDYGAVPNAGDARRAR